MHESLVDGRYRLDEKLGEGGLGVVHRVFDQVTGRSVALKALTPTAAQRKHIVDLFEREFHALKTLAHPHIVEVYDYGIGDTPYYTMELLAGTTAHDLTPMPWRHACSLLRDVASALALVHSRKLVHRDVTGRNIHRAPDGTTKLLDFGSLAHMGVAKDCVGTAPFMAPEALEMRVLDQRTDVYALGAEAYHLLTGRHAYPARELSELKDCWLHRPAPPSSLVPDLPAPLDDLVMSMIALKPIARPANASVVIARLTALASLPPLISEEAAHSFLISPQLVGRELEVTAFRKRLQRAIRGRGNCALIEALPSMGRTRILDAFGLEAQTAGAALVRVDSQDGASEASTLSAISAGLEGIAARTPANENGEVATLDMLRGVMNRRAVVILVDDAERYSSQSLALLVRLMHLTERQRLLLVIGCSLPVPPQAADALRLLRANSTHIELRALDLEQTTRLVNACFDGAQNLRATAAWAYSASGGRAGVCVALARHLVDARIASYAGGVWTLPDNLSDFTLPENLHQLLEERCRRLDMDQKLWGQLLSLISPASQCSTDECVNWMLPFMPSVRSHAALAGLSAAQLVTVNGSTTSISQSIVRDAFLTQLEAPLAQRLHALLAERFLERADEPSLAAAAHHYLCAGDQENAIRVILRYTGIATAEMSEQELAKVVLPFGHWGATFEGCLNFAERQDWPRREIYPLYTAIMTAAALSTPAWLERGQRLHAYLKEDVGLDAWSEDELSALAAGAPISKTRLVGHLLKLTTRHLFAPAQKKGLAPIAALTLLGVYVTSALSVMSVTQRFHRGITPLARSLLPFRTLSPALDVIYELLVGSADAGRGLAAGWERLVPVQVRLQSRVSGMPDIYRATANYICRYLHALECLAPLADPESLAIAAWLESVGGFETHAALLRMVYYLYAGDSERAELQKQEMEARSLATARDNLSVISGTKDLAQAQALSGDETALSATLVTLEWIVSRFPDWLGQLLVYRGEHARLVRDLVRARDELERALAFAPAGENYSWAKAVPPYLDVLVQLGDVDAALRFAELAQAETTRVRVAPVYQRHIDIAIALVWAAAGEHARAEQRLDAMIVEAHAQHLRGVSLGVLLEARAQVALQRGDLAAFERACIGLTPLFTSYDNHALMTRFERLRDAARRAGLLNTSAMLPAPRSRDFHRDLAALSQSAGVNAATRSQRALELLVEHCDANGGVLFVVRADQLQWAASHGGAPATEEIAALARSVVAAHQRVDDDLTVAVEEPEAEPSQLRARATVDGGLYTPVVLRAQGADAHDQPVIGIALLRSDSSTLLRQPDVKLLHALGGVLASSDFSISPVSAQG